MRGFGGNRSVGGILKNPKDSSSQGREIDTFPPDQHLGEKGERDQQGL